MLTNPSGVLLAYGTQVFPVPRADWWMVSTRAQAMQVLRFAQKSFPSAQLQLVDGSMDGEDMFFLMPSPNPLGYGIWIVKGFMTGDPGLAIMDDYAGDVWD